MKHPTLIGYTYWFIPQCELPSLWFHLPLFSSNPLKAKLSWRISAKLRLGGSGSLSRESANAVVTVLVGDEAPEERGEKHWLWERGGGWHWRVGGKIGEEPNERAELFRDSAEWLVGHTTETSQGFWFCLTHSLCTCFCVLFEGGWTPRNLLPPSTFRSR